MRKVDPRPLEKKAERDYVRIVRRDGTITRKLNGLGYRSWPDQWTIPKNGVDFLIEFKREGEGATELQADLHKELRKHGQFVYVCDNLEDALAIYWHHAAGKRLLWQKPH